MKKGWLTAADPTRLHDTRNRVLLIYNHSPVLDAERWFSGELLPLNEENSQKKSHSVRQ